MLCFTWKRLNMIYRKPIWAIKVTKENIDWLTDKFYQLAKEYLKNDEISKQDIYRQLKEELDGKKEKNSN